MVVAKQFLSQDCQEGYSLQSISNLTMHILNHFFHRPASIKLSTEELKESHQSIRTGATLSMQQRLNHMSGTQSSARQPSPTGMLDDINRADR